MEQIFDSEFFKGLQAMRMLDRSRMGAGLSGQRKSGAKGSSVEFSDFREYVPGDDIRRIDWNVYGRMDRLFVKEFMEEKEGLFHIVLDGSASMGFGDGGKSAMARRIAGMAAYMALGNLDRVRLVALWDREAVTGRSLTGRQAFPKILEGLSDMRFHGETHLYEALRKLPFLGRGSVILISDFLGDFSLSGQERERGSSVGEMVRFLRGRGQEVALFHVLSKEEELPREEGTAELLDGETGERLRVTMFPRARREYARAKEEFCANLGRACRKYQARYVRALAEETMEAVLYRGAREGIWGRK